MLITIQTVRTQPQNIGISLMSVEGKIVFHLKSKKNNIIN